MTTTEERSFNGGFYTGVVGVDSKTNLIPAGKPPLKPGQWRPITFYGPINHLAGMKLFVNGKEAYLKNTLRPDIGLQEGEPIELKGFPERP